MGGVFQSVASDVSSIPEGMIVTPDPGEQQAVNTIKFCIKNAPKFDILRSSSLSGTYITVSSPSGESKDVSVYVNSKESLEQGNFYADPNFTEAGEWTVTTHFGSVTYMDDSWGFVNLPDAWKEFTFSYTVSEASAEIESPYGEVPEGAIWTGRGPGVSTGRLTGKATIDFSGIYSSIDLVNPSARALIYSDYGAELQALDIEWENAEHTLLWFQFSMADVTYPYQNAIYYIILPTAGTATLLNGETVELKDMKAGPWIREKEKSTPKLTFKPSGAVNITSMPTQATVTMPSSNGSQYTVDADKLDNLKITTPQGVTTTLPAGVFNGVRVITYTLPEGWYNGPGEYTFSLDCSPLSGYNSAVDYVFPEEPCIWTVTMIETGVSPEDPVMKLDGEEFTKTSYQIEGESATVDLSVTTEDADIYYRWTPTAQEGTVEFVKYETPLTITEPGTLEYYAKKGYPQSATHSVKFTILKVLTGEDFVITPEPGKYESITDTQIVLILKDKNEVSFNDFYLAEIMTVTNPKGESVKYKAYTGPDEFYFKVDNLFEEDGIYTVDLNFDGYTVYVSSGVQAHIDPISFTYQIDTETGVGEIADESNEAVYYDLNGRRVSGELVPGIYIVHENGNVTKRLIK